MTRCSFVWWAQLKRGRVASDRVSGFKGVGSQVTDR